MKTNLFLTSHLIGILFCIAVHAKEKVSKFDDVISRKDVTVSFSAPLVDRARAEVTMKLAGLSHLTPKEFDLPQYRSLVVQLYKPIVRKQMGDTGSPVIVFSGGWGEDFRLYSTILRNISARGYTIVNIDHYYYQNTQRHPKVYDKWVRERQKEVERFGETEKQEQFMKTKVALLEIYSKDILFVIEHLSEMLQEEPNGKLEKIVLMGHSIGGNADKRVIEQMTASKKGTGRIKAFVSFDSRLNQLGLKTVFEVPTLLFGAFSWYSGKSDSLRQLPSQPNLKLKILSHTTHVSFDDFSIFSVLEKDLSPLKGGMNDFAQQELINDIQAGKDGNPERFGEQLFLGNKKEVIQFVSDLSIEVDRFLRKAVK